LHFRINGTPQSNRAINNAVAAHANGGCWSQPHYIDVIAQEQRRSQVTAQKNNCFSSSKAGDNEHANCLEH
jgi:uncharacterized membrane protein